MARIIIDFLWISVLCALAFAAISYFFPALGSPSGAVTTVVASMVSGQLFGMRTGEEISSGFAWKTAFILTVVSFALAAVVVFGFLAAGIPILPGDLPMKAMLLASLFVGVLSLLAIRFTFRFGVKQGARAKSR